jgi:TolB-like protein/DNA-binding winged helix-turn-helix (wHTH) protein
VSSLPETVQLGDWRVQPELDLIVRNGHSTKIEPRAMRVLLSLLRRAGHIVTVQELLDEVWPDVVVGPDSVYQAVALLRRTLGDDSHHPSYIAHVPRKGYRLVAPVSAVRSTNGSNTDDSAIVSPGTPAPQPEPQSVRLRFGAFAWAAIAFVTATLAALYVHLRSETAPAPQTIIARTASVHARTASGQTQGVTSIAVLPVLDMSEKQDLGYIADGFTEELIDLLSRGSDMRVPARTSSFYFKGKSATVRDIAAALGVDHLLEGSVRRSGNRLRVTAQLIRADNGYHLWSQTYDREFTEIFAVEDDIAQAVTTTLRAKLIAGRSGGETAAGTREAHNLQLQCQFFVQRNTPSDADKAVDCYRQLIGLASQDAAAWAGYADALWRQPALKESPRSEARGARDAARQAAEHALTLDPALAAAHAVLAAYHRVIDRDWAAAQAEIDAALTADPGDPAGLLAASRLAMTLGRFDRALALLERARVRDPLNFLPYARLSEIYLYQGRLAEAETASRRRLDLSPEGVGGYARLADVLLARGEPEAALEAAKREPDEVERTILLALVYHALGRRADADATLTELTRGHGDAGLELADIYAFRGENNRAFAIVAGAFAAGDGQLTSIKSDSYFKPLHADPRYRALLGKLNLPPDEPESPPVARAEAPRDAPESALSASTAAKGAR